jgi:lysophospholipase L1-like esterase
MSIYRIFVTSACVVMASLPIGVQAQSSSERCLVIGDSIAVGVSNYSRCLSISTGGLSSWRWLNRWGPELDTVDPEVVLISLGANDADDRRSFPSLAKVRAKLRAPRVIWLAPSEVLSLTSRNWVRLIAEQYGDAVFDLPQRHMQKDGIHPSTRGAQIVASRLLPE